MADGGMIEIAKATVTIVPNMAGSQSEITSQLTGVMKEASEAAGSEGGSAFGTNFAGAIKASAAIISAALTAATAAAVATGAAFINAAKETAAYGDQVDKMSQKMGNFSKSAYQEWDYILKIAGTDGMSTMTAGMKTFTNQVAEASSGSASALANFEALGISLDDLKNLSQEELFAKAIEGLQGMEAGATRSALATDLFSKSGMQLEPLLNMTSEETAELIQQANDLGMIMSDEGVQAAADFTDSMTTLKGTLTGLKNSIMANVLPGLTDVTNGLAKIFAGDKSGIELVKSGIDAVLTQISTLTPDLMLLAQAIIFGLLDAFAPQLPSMVSGIFDFLNTALLTVTELIPQLTPVLVLGLQGIASALFDALPVLITALLSVVTELVTWLASNDNVKQFSDGVVKLVTIVAKGLGDVLPILLPALFNIYGQLADSLISPETLGMLLDAVLYVIGAIVVALTASIPEIGGVVVKYFENIMDLFAVFGVDLRGGLTQLITDIQTGFTTWLTNVKNSFSTAWDNITGGVSNIASTIGGLVDTIISTLSELPSKVLGIGEDIVNGLINGVTKKNSSIVKTMQDLAGNAISAAKKKLGIASPSKAFAELGAFTAEGFGLGFDKTMSDVKTDMADTFGGLSGNMTAEVKAVGAGGSLMAGTSINAGGNTINVYASEGMDVEQLAQTIAYKLEEMTMAKGATYA